MEHNIIAITETYLDVSVTDSEVAYGDWSVPRRDRDTPCGGVLLAARAPILLRRHPKLESVGGGEDLWASFEFYGKRMYVCIFYIKSNAPEYDFYMRWFTKAESFINKL